MSDRDIELGITYNAAKGLSEIEKTEKALGDLDKAAKRTQDSFDKTGKAAKDAGSGMASIMDSASGLAGIAAAAGAVSTAILGTATAGVQAAAVWEDAFAGVKKTVEGTDAEFKKLDQDLRDMAKSSPLAATEIAGVAEAAGALGVAKKDIVSFTKTMTTLGATTNLSAQAAADQIARLNNIMGDAPDAGNYEAFGSALVYLGNQSAATEQQIVAMATRIAGAGAQSKMSQASVLGVASALSSVGLSSEMGGSAISRFILQMQSSVDTGDKFLATFEKMYQKSGQLVQGAKTFAEAWRKDAASALGAFFSGLKKAQDQGESTIKTLSELGVTEVRLRDTILRATEASTMFGKSLSDARMASKNGQKANEEFAKRVETLKSQVEILRNRWNMAWVAIGDAFMPIAKAIVATLNAVALVVVKLAEGFKALPAPIHYAVAALGAFAAAVATAAGSLAAWKAAGTFFPVALDAIATKSPKAAEALAQFAVAGKLDLSKGKEALKGFMDALSFKGAKLVGRDEITGRFKALDQGALTLGRLTTNLKVMTVEALKAGATGTWAWLKTLPAMFATAAQAAKGGLTAALASMTVPIGKLSVLAGGAGVAGAVGLGLAIGKLADAAGDAAEEHNRLTDSALATANAMGKSGTDAQKYANQLVQVRANLEKVTAQVGLVEGGVSLLSDALGRPAELLDNLAKKFGIVGTAAKAMFDAFGGKAFEAIGWGIAEARKSVEWLGRAMYESDPPASQLAAKARDLAAASKIAGKEITDWGKAQKLIADNKATQDYWAAETKAIHDLGLEAGTSLAKATAHIDSYKKHLAEARFETLTKGMTEEQKKGFKGVDIQVLLDAYDAAKNKAVDAESAGKAFVGAVDEVGKKSAETAKEVQKFASSMKGWVATEEITKMQGALANLGGASKLSSEAVLQHGAAFAEAAKKGQTFTGELANLVARYNEVAQAAQRASIMGKMDPAAIKSYREWAAALESVGAVNVPTDQIEAFAGKIIEARNNGEALGDEAKKVVDEWGRIQEAEAAMARFQAGIEQATTATQSLLAAMDEKALAASTEAIATAIESAMLKAGDTLDFSNVNDAVLKQSFEMLRSLGQQYAEAGKGLPEALYQQLILAGETLKSRGLGSVVTGIAEEFPTITAATDAATKATFDWNAALETTANIMQVLGIESQSTLGKIVGGIQGVMGSLENLKSFAAVGSKGGILDGIKGIFGGGGLNAKGPGALGKRWAAGGAVAGVLGSASAMFGGQKTTAGRALGGAAMGAQLGSIAGQWGMAAGAVVGAVVGAFKKPSWVKVGKDAGKVLGMKVSDELAQQIEATKKALKLDTKTAALLNLSAAVKESGKEWSAFGGQINDLFTLAAKGGKVGAEAVKQIEEAWGGVREEAEAANRVGDKTTRQMIAQAKATGQMTAAMKDFLKERAALAAGGAGALTRGLFMTDEDGKALTTMTEAQGAALAGNFIAAFDAAVGELGLLGATDAMREDFAKLSESMEKAFGKEQMQKLLGPIGGLFSLTAPDSPFRGAAEAGQGLADIVKGLADTGRLTQAQFANLGISAKQAFDQATAAGANQQQAIETILPYLQNMWSASKEYGYTLDENTQALIKQAQEAGYTFKTDPIERTADAVEMLVVALNKAFKLGMDLGDAFGRVATNATAAANAASNVEPPDSDFRGGSGRPDSEPLLNNGGIVNAPLSGMRAILHGPEAVIPLDKLSSLLSSGQQAQPQPQVINVTTTAPLTVNQNPFLAADTQDEANRRIVATVVEALQRRDAALIAALPTSAT